MKNNGKKVLYPITDVYIKMEASEPISEDFKFVIRGDSYRVGFRVGEELNFTIDWGDGNESIVLGSTASETQVDRSHTYSNSSDWIITIKNYVSGWIDFNSNSPDREKLIKVLSPFYKSDRTNFYGCFYNCTSLISIPENLFSNNINAIIFDLCFILCRSLTSIPENLFKNNINVTSVRSCFSACSSLTSIPENLFINNVNAINFEGCFQQCISLISIPENLFSNNANINGFSICFAQCRNLHNINIKFHQNVLERNTNYSSMFSVLNSSFSHTGVAPELWNLAVGTTGFNRSGCFRNNTALDNWNDIPFEWR